MLHSYTEREGSQPTPVMLPTRKFTLDEFAALPLPSGPNDFCPTPLLVILPDGINMCRLTAYKGDMGKDFAN